MSEIASPGQLRAAFLRWALVLVPGVLLLGFLSGASVTSGPENPWFASLEKPSLFPPPATFRIVWSALYVMMGLAAALVVTARGASARGAALAAFVVQLVLNLAWSPVFFGLHDMKGALLLLVGIDVAVLATVLLFWRVRTLAGMLLLPYLGWVLFATVLNWQFIQANPDGGSESGAQSSVDFEA